MRWPSSFVAILLCIAVSADTDRPRRDLQTILKIKDAIASKIFGTNCSNTEKQNATFYRIPGHENILIKAVPIGLHINQGAELINVPASPQNPTLALLESYLETSTPDDTLKALQRAQTLIQSGILTDQAALDKLLVHSRYPGQVLSYIAQDNYLYPGPLQAPLPAVPKPLPILTSGISYFDAPVGGPIHNSYGVPIFQQPILFKEPKPLRPPTVHHHTILTGVRPETRVPAVVYGAFNPFFDEKVNVQKISKPASSYSYTQLHRNGAASTYGAQMPAEVAQVRPLVLERITEITNRLPNIVRPHIHSHPPRFSTIHRLPEVVVQDHYHPSVLNIPQQGGFSYKQVHNDGSVSTYYNNETPVRPVLLELPPKTSRLVKKYDGKGGYYYERINADGSVTRCLDSEGRVPVPLSHFQSKPPVMHPIVHDRIEAIATAPSQPAPAPPKISTQVNNSAGNQASNGYSYQQINSDGSVSSFHSSQVSSAASPQQVVRPKPVRLPPPAVPEVELEHTVVVGAPLGPAPVVTLYDAPGVVATDPRGQQPVNVFPIPSGSPHIHKYPVHVHAPPSHVHIQYPHQPLPSIGQQIASDVSVHKITNFVRPVHHHVESIGAGGFIYKQLQKDGSVTTQTSSGKVEGSQNLHVNSAAQKETQGAFVRPILGNYVYKQIVHNNPNFTVVKVENPSPVQSPSIDRRFGTQGSYSYKQVTNINAAPVKPVATAKPVATSKPLTSRVTQSGSKDQVKVIVGEDSIGTHSASGNFKYVQTNSPASTTTTTSQKVKPEDSLENNPIIVSDVTKAPAVNFSYKQSHDDGTTTSFQSSNENHITVKVNSEQEHQRGDIP
ncbi:unnamed protein product [Plutella xylostella]|uniref:(diamondback moth) hypothetical protein n=1 Tax=Plutella xylostella TaxID=51655 RepID=A0A8S4E4B4_PLUXY|nr:unnamed protein product [Plutella xylostella]